MTKNPQDVIDASRCRHGLIAGNCDVCGVRPRMSDKAMKEIESHFDNDREAFRLLDLINAEFQSDPMSVQCFDLGVVQRVKACVEKRKELAKSNPVWID